jgi:hypothetical protein
LLVVVVVGCCCCVSGLLPLLACSISHALVHSLSCCFVLLENLQFSFDGRR